MVPGHPFNEMKPNSGDAAAEPDPSTARKFLQIRTGLTKIASDFVSHANHDLPQSSSSRGRVIDEMREPLPHVARLVEMAGYAFRAPAHGKREAAKIGQDGEHALVGDIVTDKNWTATFERLVGHQFEDA